jgi:putative hydrolase of the HAD superfamily
MAIRAVGFDLDETLAVPARDRATILREAARAVGAPPLSREAYLEAHGRHLTRESREPIFADLLADHGAAVDPGRLAEAYRDRISSSLDLLDGTADLLATLGREYPVGLLTNGPAVAQRDKIDVLGVGDAFDATLVTGDLPAGKPDARAFEALLAALDADAGVTAYVGDDPDADVAGASGAGLVAVQVCYEGGPEPSPLADAHVDRSTLAATLPDLLQSL